MDSLLLDPDVLLLLVVQAGGFRLDELVDVLDFVLEILHALLEVLGVTLSYKQTVPSWSSEP